MFAHFWEIFEHFWKLLGSFGTILGVFWDIFGTFLDFFGKLLEHFWEVSGTLLGQFFEENMKKNEILCFFELKNILVPEIFFS